MVLIQQNHLPMVHQAYISACKAQTLAELQTMAKAPYYQPTKAIKVKFSAVK